MSNTIFMCISLLFIVRVSPPIEPGMNSLHEIYGDGFMLTNSSILRITTQPVDQNDCKGNKATFSVTTDGGSGPVHYQWLRKRPSDSAFLSFGAGDSTKLPVYNIGVGTESPNGTQYKVTVTDGASTLTSSIATLTVNEITGIAPIGVATYTVKQGENLTFQVLTSGKVPTAYQWIKKFGTSDWRDLSDGKTISGSQCSLLNFTKIARADSGIYKLRVTFPTANGISCIETSTITRKIIVLPALDTIPPGFVNLPNSYKTLCPEPLQTATWNEALSDILPERTNYYELTKAGPVFDLLPANFSDNITVSENLILHWGIFYASSPNDPVKDETGKLLNNITGQISKYPECIRLRSLITGSQFYQIVFWLEDEAGNLTPPSGRHKIQITIPLRPEITQAF